MKPTLEGIDGDQNGNGPRQNQGPEVLKSSNTQKVATTLSGGTEHAPENDEKTLAFGLTLVEKQSIEADINAGKPIMATPAYTKFLAALLPNGLKIEDERGLLKFSHDIPEYEIHNGAIRANHAGAISIISQGLSELFAKPVHFLTSTEVQSKIAEYGHFAGCRDADNGKSGSVDLFGCGWVDGDADDEYAPYAWRYLYGNGNSGRGNRRNGLSLFPCFG